MWQASERLRQSLPLMRNRLRRERERAVEWSRGPVRFRPSVVRPLAAMGAAGRPQVALPAAMQATHLPPSQATLRHEVAKLVAGWLRGAWRVRRSLKAGLGLC